MSKMSRYKEEIQAIFEDLVFARYANTDYWDLPEDEQYQLYLMAEQQWRDRMADRADYLRKAERER